MQDVVNKKARVSGMGTVWGIFLKTGSLAAVISL
jgi:hypothetical protein